MSATPIYQGYPSFGSGPVTNAFPGYPLQQSTNLQPAAQPVNTTAFPSYPLQQTTYSPANPAILYPTTETNLSPAQAPLLETYNTNPQFKFNPSPLNPILFRHPNQQHLPYSVSLSHQQMIDPSTLTHLKIYLDSCLNGFNPWEINSSHPIHAELFNICKPILEQIKNLSLEKKTDYLKKVIPEIVSGCNEFPSDPVFAGKFPKFELLELGLRSHFYAALTAEQRGIIESCYKARNQKILPHDLDQRETLLHQIATRNDFYLNPLPNMYENLIQQLVEGDLSNAIANTAAKLPLDKAIAKSEKFIASQLKNLLLTKPSQCAMNVEAFLRSQMTRKLVTILADQYKNTFQKTGLVDKAQLKNESDKLQLFLTKNEQFFINWSPYAQLMVEFFELDLSSQAPFTSARAKTYQQETQRLEAVDSAKKPNKLFNWAFSSVKTKEQQKQEIHAVAQKQQETIDAAEGEWNALIQPPPLSYPAVIPSAPEIEPEEIPTVQTPPAALEQPIQTPPQPIIQQTAPFVAIALPSNPDKQEIPLISYIDIAFEDLLKIGNDKEKWNSLPMIVQKDVIRHLNYHPNLKGQAEEVASRIFTRMDIFDQMGPWNKRKFTEANNGLDKQFVTDGQALLDFLYSDKNTGKYHEFVQRFQALSKNELFYQYVYEMAVKANVHIESWDHEFAKYNWDRPHILPLSIQALERCLHAASKKS